MASEHDARAQAFYDHQLDEPSPRRRRAAADWGVGEDIFDRMPSRRFTRGDRRAEHRDELEAPRVERRISGPAAAPRADDWAGEHERRQLAPRSGDWPEAEPRRATADAPERLRYDGGEFVARRVEPGELEAESGEAGPRRRRRRPAESWTDDIPAVSAEEGKRPVQSWLEPEPGKELALAPGESRTIVLEATAPEAESEPAIEPLPEDPPGRRTVMITGHPDPLPVARAPRPAKTAVERVGHRPDRIVGYAVALGILLVVIAILTTGH